MPPWIKVKNMILCIYNVLATNIALAFVKQRDGSKAREMGDKIQRVVRSSILEEASKLLGEGKNLN